MNRKHAIALGFSIIALIALAVSTTQSLVILNGDFTTDAVTVVIAGMFLCGFGVGIALSLMTE